MVRRAESRVESLAARRCPVGDHETRNAYDTRMLCGTRAGGLVINCMGPR